MSSFSKKIKLFDFLNFPVDFNKKFFGEPLLGNHKTWRGVITGATTGIVVVYLQGFLYQFDIFKKISIIDYSHINLLLLGVLFSSGAIFGDLLFAFIKRRLKIPPGNMFIFFDQTNYVIGAFIFVQGLLKIDLLFWLAILVITFLLHIIIVKIGYYLHLSDAEW